MSGKPPFITPAEVSILSRKYRFIDFFVPGVIAMAVMTASLFGAVNVNAELRQKGYHQKAVHYPHHPYRLDPVECSVPVSAFGPIHDGDTIW